MSLELESMTICPMDGALASTGVIAMLIVQLVDGTGFGFIKLRRSSNGELTVSCEQAIVIVDRRNPAGPRAIRSEERAPLEKLVTDYLAELWPGTGQ